MREIVEYHNNLNKLTLTNWSPGEMDFFFLVLCKIRDQGTKEIKLTTEDFSSVISRVDYKWDRIIETASSIQKKVFALVYINKKETIKENGKKRTELSPMFLFKDFNIMIDEEDERNEITGRIVVSEHFEYLVNKLSGNFTSWELQEFFDLGSNYSKTMYRLLKEYKNTGALYMTIEEFKMLLGIPEGYRISNIDQRVLEPIMRELPQYFEGLRYEKKKRGRKIASINFFFIPEYKTNNEQRTHLKNNEKNVELEDYIGLAIETHNISREKAEEMSMHYLAYAKNKKPTNLKAYTKDCIIKDYDSHLSQINIKELQKAVKKVKNKFHNFKGQTENMSDEEIERQALELTRKRIEKNKD